ncbi:MAG: hypothetical protein M1837_006259 [Sclerophora amabilis]|nr:MAG: hypothetical protein M1837_006259 [Sclerophora amabilis]
MKLHIVHFALFGFAGCIFAVPAFSAIIPQFPAWLDGQHSNHDELARRSIPPVGQPLQVNVLRDSSTYISDRQMVHVEMFFRAASDMLCKYPWDTRFRKGTHFQKVVRPHISSDSKLLLLVENIHGVFPQQGLFPPEGQPNFGYWIIALRLALAGEPLLFIDPYRGERRYTLRLGNYLGQEVVRVTVGPVDSEEPLPQFGTDDAPTLDLPVTPDTCGRSLHVQPSKRTLLPYDESSSSSSSSFYAIDTKAIHDVLKSLSAHLDALVAEHSVPHRKGTFWQLTPGNGADERFSVSIALLERLLPAETRSPPIWLLVSVAETVRSEGASVSTNECAGEIQYAGQLDDLNKFGFQAVHRLKDSAEDLTNFISDVYERKAGPSPITTPSPTKSMVDRPSWEDANDTFFRQDVDGSQHVSSYQMERLRRGLVIADERLCNSDVAILENDSLVWQVPASSPGETDMVITISKGSASVIDSRTTRSRWEILARLARTGWPALQILPYNGERWYYIGLGTQEGVPEPQIELRIQPRDLAQPSSSGLIPTVSRHSSVSNVLPKDLGDQVKRCLGLDLSADSAGIQRFPISKRQMTNEEEINYREPFGNTCVLIDWSEFVVSPGQLEKIIRELRALHRFYSLYSADTLMPLGTLYSVDVDRVEDTDRVRRISVGVLPGPFNLGEAPTTNHVRLMLHDALMGIDEDATGVIDVGCYMGQKGYQMTVRNMRGEVMLWLLVDISPADRMRPQPVAPTRESVGPSLPSWLFRRPWPGNDNQQPDTG